MDPLDLSLGEFAKYWPRYLREELATVGVSRVRELLSLTPMDVVCAPKGSRGLLAAVVAECRDYDIDGTQQAYRAILDRLCERRGRTQPDRPPIPHRDPWACIYVAMPDQFDSSEPFKDFVVPRIVRHFEQAGFRASFGASARTDEELASWFALPRPRRRRSLRCRPRMSSLVARTLSVLRSWFVAKP